jgi:hypothetical protein
VIPIEPVVIFIKSYEADFRFLRRLLISIAGNNLENIPVCVALPHNSIPDWLLELEKSKTLKIFSEEIWEDLIGESTPGYISQQIIKLNVDRLEVAENYLILDSDTIFLRPFFRSDFLELNTGSPYLFADEGRETLEPFYRGYVSARRGHLELIREKLGVFSDSGAPWLEAHNSLVFSSSHLSAFRSYIESGSIPGANNYIDLIDTAPYEFNWYVSWVAKQDFAGHVVKPPIFKMWHTGEHFLQSVMSGWTIQDVAALYVGVIPNSSWSGTGRIKFLKSLFFSVASTGIRSLSRGSILHWWFRLSG